MNFYVIYSFDCDKDEKISMYAPKRSKSWYRSEAGTCEDIPNWKHRKYCGLLTRKELDEFISDQCLEAENIDTMGSLTLEFGWLPAISMTGYSYDSRYNAYLCYQNAYVTPLIERKAKPCDEHDWERVKKAFLEVYG